MASDDLRARITEALNTTPTKLLDDHPESLAFHADQLTWDVISARHDRHTYMATCALCRGEADTLTDAVMAVVQPELDELRGKVTALEACYEVVAADAMAHGQCALKRHSLLQRAEKAEAERDRLTAELHRHADCAQCGHERHRHGYEPIIRRDWCSDCPTTNDLHTFQSKETLS